MKSLKTLWAVSTVAVMSMAMAQSDGGRFDAAVVLTPGMTLQRGAVFMTGGFQSAMLRHGDVVSTDRWMSGSYHILTSDGTVIGMAPGATVAIDGRRIGFDVFRVMSGFADILGNVNNGYPMPLEFRRFMPFRFGNVTVFPDPDPWEVPIGTMPRVSDQVFFPNRF